MIRSNAIADRIGNPAPFMTPPVESELGPEALAGLYLLRARLAIFLYRHPLDNSEQIMDLIDNTESIGEIKLLLDYVLAQRVLRRGLKWTDSAAVNCGWREPAPARKA